MLSDKQRLLALQELFANDNKNVFRYRYLKNYYYQFSFVFADKYIIATIDYHGKVVELKNERTNKIEKIDFAVVDYPIRKAVKIACLDTGCLLAR